MSPKHFYETESQSTSEIQKENPMNRTQHLLGTFGIALCSALLGCAVYGQPSASIGVSAPSVEVALPSVEIRADSDFYEPLAPEGEWVTVGSYGRCWRPSGVAIDWRPYCNGSWEQTDAGWYWVSDEPWAWATYHYGRWDYADQYGWYWVPQTQWAPAWVSWHEGGGYVGWAPLQPFVSISVNGFEGFDQARISPRAFVFVKQGQFLSPIRPSIVVVNNTTIINKTKFVTNTRIVNNTVINGGPATAAIEKASGRKVQIVQVQQLRHQAEAPVAARQRTSKATTEIKTQAPARNEVVPEKQKVVAHVPALAEKPDAITRAPAAPTVKNYEAPVEKRNPAPMAPESKPEVKQETGRAPAIKETTEQNTPRQPARQEKPAPAEEKRAQQPAREQPATNEKNGADQADKNHDNKP